MLKINFGRKIKDLLGREVGDGNLGLACAFALANAGVALPKDRKFARGVLGQRILAARVPLDLTAEEIAEIKDAVGEWYVPGLMTPIWQTLEGR